MKRYSCHGRQIKTSRYCRSYTHNNLPIPRSHISTFDSMSIPLSMSTSICLPAPGVPFFPSFLRSGLHLCTQDVSESLLSRTNFRVSPVVVVRNVLSVIKTYWTCSSMIPVPSPPPIFTFLWTGSS